MLGSCLLVCFVAVLSAGDDRAFALGNELNGVNTDTVSFSETFETPHENGTGCTCIKYNCGCCVYVAVPIVGLNDTACVNVTYLPSPVFGISVTFSLDGVVFYNNTISAKDPPPLCFGVPYLEKLASLCLRFYDVAWSNKSFSACVRLEVKLTGLLIDKFELGCFKIPPAQVRTGQALRYVTKDRLIHPRKMGSLRLIKLFKRMLEKELKEKTIYQ